MKRFLSLLMMTSLITPTAAFANHESRARDWEDDQPRAEQWFFRDLPRHIGGDFKEAFWNGWHLLFLAGGAGLLFENLVTTNGPSSKARAKLENLPISVDPEIGEQVQYIRK